MKTVLIAISWGQLVRDLLRTDFYRLLRGRPDLRIVLVTPYAADDAFREEMEGRNVIFEPLDTAPPGPLENLLRKSRVAVFSNRHRISTMLVKVEEFRREGPIQRALAGLFSSKAISNKATAASLRWLEARLCRHRRYARLLKRYRPDLVFVSPVFLAPDQYVLKEAKLLGIPTVVQVGSWDNLTNKGEIPVIPEKAIVWNEVNKQQLIRYHCMKPEDILVSGPPQFDIYTDTARFESRAAFCRRFGLDPRKRIILYATVPSFPDEYDCIRMVDRAIKDGRIRDAQLLVRPHPRDPKPYAEIVRERIPFDEGVLFKKRVTDSRFWSPTRAEMYHLATTLHHAAVCVNTASTMALDALASGRPAIHVGFDGERERPYIESVRRYYDFEHQRPLVETRAIPVAKNEKELIAHINACLEDPTLRSAERKEALQLLCNGADGRSGRRIARHVLSLVGLSGKRGRGQR